MTYVPTSTYRVQVQPAFDLDATAALVGYLDRLGVGAVYTSPLLAATPGSTHGYDVVDPTRANPELGGEQARRRLVKAANDRGLGVVLDLVPNHMSVEVPAANPWWWDVLTHGQESPYATYFDIDWSRGPILLPVLGDEPALELRDGRLAYYDHEFPIAPGTGDGTPDEVHERQHYRLVHWHRGNAELTYRRFFDVTSLAAVRVEDPGVFAATHAEVLRWARAGEVDGLRIDHPDGLADPGAYLHRLRDATGCWLVVEKILAAGEELPASWPVDGTTGYDALRQLCGVFVDPSGEAVLTELAAAPDFHTEAEHCRRLITERSLVAEVNRIAALAPGVPPAAVAELMVAFPVYRSYLPEGLANWNTAVDTARRRRPDLAAALDTLDRTVRADPHGELATRVQQTSGMVVAKGDEDTAFYRYPRLTALNEVGGAPDRFGVTPAEFHAGAAAREAGRPATMTTLSTHDTKRSEDVRARLAVLAEVADEFAGAVRRWSARLANGSGIGEPTLDLLAWQSLVGAWPITPERLAAYLDKAAKEAKIRTSWVDHDEAFEAAVRAWPAEVMADPDLRADVEAFADRVRRPGWSNALGQKLLHLAGPGVPDVYQGTELFDLSLVDPDNRRQVDYAVRHELLDRLASGWLPDWDSSADDSADNPGAAKLHVVATTLRLRRQRPDLFTGYRPLHADGPAADHALAFARAGVVAVATRLPVTLARTGWHDTILALPPGTWTDHLTNRPVPGVAPLADLLDRYPVALLVREP